MPDKQGEWTDRENRAQWDMERRESGELITMSVTKRDPRNQQTMIALAHLLAAKDAREQYDRLLTRAIVDYGDRHQPVPGWSTKSGKVTCTRCDAIGHDYDRLNHQTGSMISGIYADHFPDLVKDQLRFYARLITQQTEHAIAAWKRAGRRYSTFRSHMAESRQLASGRVSYY